MKCAYHLCQNDVYSISRKQKRFCCRQCSNKYKVRKWRIELKKKAIEYKGGQCSVCGYSKCVWALEFHHRDREQKEFNISRNGSTRSWERVKAELDKCDILCSNCHKEIEAKLNEDRCNQLNLEGVSHA